MKKLLIFISITAPLLGAAQLFEGEDYEYNSELIWGVNKSSNGGLIGGLMVRYSRSKGENFYETFGPMAYTMYCHAVGLRDLGPTMSAMNAYLSLTGAETLQLRMKKKLLI